MILAAVLMMMAPGAVNGGVLPQTLHLPDTTVSPVEVEKRKKRPAPDATINMASTADADVALVGIWPASAYHNTADGAVRLRCWIDVHGLAERCDVADERPAKLGFGKAALELRPTIKLAPTMGPNGPIGSYKIIAVVFRAPDERFDMARFAENHKDPSTMAIQDVHDYFQSGHRAPLPMRKVTMLDNPVWVSAASFDDLAAAYPGRPGPGEGYAVDHCMVRPDGSLENCQSIKEEPAGHGFGKAALGLAAKFRISAEVAQTPHKDELWVDIPIRFPNAKELADREVSAPSWVQVFDTKAGQKVFPPEAAANGVTSGRGVARCNVGQDGALVACAPEGGDPEGQGFSEAAAKLAATMKMNLWSSDGAPVQGAVVRVPIRLNLKAAATTTPGN